MCSLPDDKNIDTLNMDFNKKYSEKLKAEHEFFKKKDSLLGEGRKRLGIKDLSWKYSMLQTVLSEYNEPFLNLHFLGPWFKDCQSSMGSLELIFELLWVLSLKSKEMLL